MASLQKPWPVLQDHLTQFIYKESKFALPCIAGGWVWGRVSTPLLMHCYLLSCSKWPMRFKQRSKEDQTLPLQFWQQHLFARSVLSMWSQNHYYSSLLKHEAPQFLCPANLHGHKEEFRCGRVTWWESIGFLPQLHTPSERELTNFLRLTSEKKLQRKEFCNKCS